MRKKILFILAGIGLLVAGWFARPSPPAVAGTNGQQVSFYVLDGQDVGPGISQMQIAGADQNGNFSTWFKTYEGQGTTYDTTTNWWWKGPVTFSFFPVGGDLHQCTVDVPEHLSYKDEVRVAISFTQYTTTCFEQCDWDYEKNQCRQ